MKETLPNHTAKLTIRSSIQFCLLFLLVAAGLILPNHASAAPTLDQSHSSAVFTVTHLGFSKVNGNFKSISADIDVTDKGEIKKFSTTAKVDSINTENSKRDGHLKSGDFFDTKKFPEITLKMISGNAKSLTADLTIKGITKRIKFAKSSGIVNTGRNNVFGMNLEATINRMDFKVGEGFLAKTISEEIDLVLSFEFKL